MIRTSMTQTIADKTHDAGSLYDATLTYADGSQTAAGAIVMQDTAGNLYLIPWSG